ncbi:uncharacterized protein LOC126841490 isoform X2 [Adelges cooleyi]|uniref:uncharacterized protein LOC126841490 isoform X2 n=1 Tax=Adelges cooleyi TaxID=133065 RepID=UPI0021800174|nr:uncharacterized protein LOC126841490 isoform X2 [Adelges cooleyi]
MKLFCLLMSFFCVGVLANNYETYMNNVNTINEAMKIAYEKNDVTLGIRSGLNALECVIERMVDDVNDARFYKDFDHTEILTRIPTFLVLEPLEKANMFNFILLREIERMIDQYCYGYTRKLRTMKELGDERRKYVLLALTSIIRRRILDESVGHVDDDATLLPKCRILGLYLSTQFPESFTKELKIDSTINKCIFMDENNAIRIYGKIDDTWYYINQFTKLEEQLRLGVPPETNEEDGANTIPKHFDISFFNK